MFTRVIHLILSSKVDFPKVFSHVVDIEISNFRALRARYRNSVSLGARARKKAYIIKNFGALRAPISSFRLPGRASARDGYMQISLVQPKVVPFAFDQNVQIRIPPLMLSMNLIRGGGILILKDILRCNSPDQLFADVL